MLKYAMSESSSSPLGALPPADHVGGHVGHGAETSASGRCAARRTRACAATHRRTPPRTPRTSGRRSCAARRRRPTISCSTPASLERLLERRARPRRGMPSSAPPISARIGASSSAGTLRRAGRAVAARAGPAVEADRAGETVPAAAASQECRPPKQKPTVKIAVAPSRTKPRDGGGDVGLHAFRRRLLDVRHVLEVVVSLLGARGPSEVVDRDRRVPALGEAERELLVEAVEPADVRAGSRSRRRSARRASPRTRRTGCRRPPRGRGRRARRPRPRAPGSAAASRGRSTRQENPIAALR